MLATWLLLSLPFTAPVSGSPQEQDDSVLLVRAQRAIVAPGDVRENVAFLVREGVITAVGEGLEAPEGARVIEGAVVCAGFMNPWSSLGVESASAADLRTTPASRTADALDATQMMHLEADALSGGVTSARVQAGMRAQVGGFGSLLRCGTSDGEVLPDLVLPEACFGASVGVSRGGRATDIIDRYSEITRLAGKIAGVVQGFAGSAPVDNGGEIKQGVVLES